MLCLRNGCITAGMLMQARTSCHGFLLDPTVPVTNPKTQQARLCKFEGTVKRTGLLVVEDEERLCVGS
jgi:hypothetical protein